MDSSLKCRHPLSGFLRVRACIVRTSPSDFPVCSWLSPHLSLAWSQKICPHPAGRITAIWPRNLQQRDGEDPAQYFNSSSVYRDLLGVVAAKFFFLDRSSRVDGSTSVRY